MIINAIINTNQICIPGHTNTYFITRFSIYLFVYFIKVKKFKFNYFVNLINFFHLLAIDIKPYTYTIGFFCLLTFAYFFEPPRELVQRDPLCS